MILNRASFVISRLTPAAAIENAINRSSHNLLP